MDVPRVIIQSKNHPKVTYVIAPRWTSMIMGGIGEEIMAMDIMVTHTKTLNLGILTLVTHPLPEMIVIIVKKATPLRITANAPAHLILIMIGIPIMKDSIKTSVIRALVEVNRKTKVADVGHLDLPIERRCRCSELLLIISRSVTTTIIRGLHLADVMKHHLDKME